MSIINEILNKYQEIVGQFLLVKPTLIKIKREIILKKKFTELLPKIERMLIDYEPLFDTLTSLLKDIGKIKEGKGSEVNLTNLIKNFISFSSKANSMITETGKFELLVFGSSKLRPVSLLPPIAYFILGGLLGLWLKKGKR